MNKKSIYIILFCFLALFVLLLSAILTIGIMSGNKFEFGKQEYHIVQDKTYPVENIKQIKVDLVSDDIRVFVTDKQEVRLVEHGNKNAKKKRVHSKLSEGTLNIYSKKKFCLLFCFTNSSKLDIYIPKTYIHHLSLTSVSGDITIPKNQSLLTLKNVDIETTSGDISLNSDIKGKHFTLSSVSGDIQMKSILADEIDIDATSGDVEADNLSGKITTSTISGDIEINAFHITGNSNFETVSGEIDIRLTKESNCHIKTDTVSGEKNIFNQTTGSNPHQLYLETVSGDITVTQKSR